ncbi:hypothetical protein Bpla01_49490 [Burkholderia plantarii]|nr:hypothetical protein Bpla01_49490 [Burkholderia plantarii]
MPIETEVAETRVAEHESGDVAAAGVFDTVFHGNGCEAGNGNRARKPGTRLGDIVIGRASHGLVFDELSMPGPRARACPGGRLAVALPP